MQYEQTLINFALASISALLGFFLNATWRAVKDLQARDLELADKVSRIEVLVAGEYVRKDELDRKIEAIFSKLDRIESKLDQKADRLDRRDLRE